MSDKGSPGRDEAVFDGEIRYVDGLPVSAMFSDRFEKSIPSHRRGAAFFNAGLLAQRIGADILIEPGIGTYGMPSVLYSMLAGSPADWPCRCEGQALFSGSEGAGGHPDADRRAKFGWELSRLRDDVIQEITERPFTVKDAGSQEIIAVGWSTTCYAARSNTSPEEQTRTVRDSIASLCELAFPMLADEYSLVVLEPKNSFVFPGESSTVIFFGKGRAGKASRPPFAAHDDEDCSPYPGRTVPKASGSLSLVRTSVDDEHVARCLAASAVHEGLAASAHIRTVASYYKWRGEIFDGAAEFEVEFLCDPGCVRSLTAMIGDRHPYECPELLVTAASTPSPAFAEWANATEA